MAVGTGLIAATSGLGFRWVADHLQRPVTEVSGWCGPRDSTASKAGYDEGLMLTPNGLVDECFGENVFVSRHDTLITPPLSAAALEGITQNTVFTLARDLGFEVAAELEGDHPEHGVHLGARPGFQGGRRQHRPAPT